MLWIRRTCMALLLIVIVGAMAGSVALWSSGYQLYVVQTASMVPAISPGDVVIDRPVRDGVRVGDVITFQHSSSPDLVTHRVTAVTDGQIRTKGDANRTEDAWSIDEAQVHGIVSLAVPLAGFAIVYLRQPSGLASLATVAMAWLLLWQLFFPSTNAPRHKLTLGEMSVG